MVIVLQASGSRAECCDVIIPLTCGILYQLQTFHVAVSCFSSKALQ